MSASGRTLDEAMGALPAERRARIEARAAARVKAEMGLVELRKARRMTQETLAAALGVEQESVSRMERRADLLISTLRRSLQAMGGDLRLIATFPDQEPVEIRGIGDL